MTEAAGDQVYILKGSVCYVRYVSSTAGFGSRG